MKIFVRLLSYLSLLFCCVKAATSQSNTVELAVTSNCGNTIGGQYCVNVTVGTPGQPQTILLDTGSSDTIFLASNASMCEKVVCDSGTFDSSKSTTSNMTKSGALDSRYFDGTRMMGDLITDVLHLDDRMITNFPMGLAKEGRLPYAPYVGVLGLGYSSRTAHLHNGVKAFPGFVDTLVQAGAISSRLYSIYLNKLDSYGAILFGGIDTEKYKGPLTTLNLFKLDQPHRVDSFYMQLMKVNMYPSNGPNQTIFQATENVKWATVLDTGTPGWVLPSSAYHKLIGYAGVFPEGGYYPKSGISKNSFVKPCSEVTRGVDNATYFELTFAGNGTNTATLQLELADLFTPLTDRNGSAVVNRSGQQMCWLRVSEAQSQSESAFSMTSSNVMRAGYWVFDLDNGQVSVAQAKPRANSSNIVQVEAGAEGLSKAANNLRAETQKVKVNGQISASVIPRLSTVASTASHATSTESRSSATGIARLLETPSGPGSIAPMRRSESAAAAIMVPGTVGFWYLAAFFVILSIKVLV
ncbi:acid protease, partial [Aureobasidium melanogenum]